MGGGGGNSSSLIKKNKLSVTRPRLKLEVVDTKRKGAKVRDGRIMVKINDVLFLCKVILKEITMSPSYQNVLNSELNLGLFSLDQKTDKLLRNGLIK